MGDCNTLKSFPNPHHCDPHLDQTKLNDLLPLTIDGVLIRPGSDTETKSLTNILGVLMFIPRGGGKFQNQTFFSVGRNREEEGHYTKDYLGE